MSYKKEPILIDCDDEGFLTDSGSWNKTVANQLAQLEGIEKLDKQQWEFITTLRQYYYTFHKLPQLRRVCHMQKLGNNCANELFHNHSVEAWRIAGLPDPGEEAKSYM